MVVHASERFSMSPFPGKEVWNNEGSLVGLEVTRTEDEVKNVAVKNMTLESDYKTNTRIGEY